MITTMMILEFNMSCIIVMGCYRSGTSAVAGTLHHLGVFMGERFDQPNANNKKGYWEDLDFKDLHKEFEECVYFSDQESQDVADKKYKLLVSKRESEHKLWGIKDPRLCNLYLLEKIISCLTTDHKMIVCRRSVEEIADSLARSTGNDRQIFVSSAQAYVDGMNRSIEKYTGPILEVHKTDSMLQILEPICQFVGLQPNQSSIDFLS
jgi:hypothetical protein